MYLYLYIPAPPQGLLDGSLLAPFSACGTGPPPRVDFLLGPYSGVLTEPAVKVREYSEYPQGTRSTHGVLLRWGHPPACRDRAKSGPRPYSKYSRGTRSLLQVLTCGEGARGVLTRGTLAWLLSGLQ